MSCLALVKPGIDLATELATDLQALRARSTQLEGVSAEARVEWALQHLPVTHALSSSFGAQSAVALHLLASRAPKTPVVLVDTGYLFPETYQFIDQLRDRFDLNLHIYRSPLSAAWQEARFGKLWEQGLEGIEHYNALNKVEPMQRALAELRAGTWFAGLRRSQSSTRRKIDVLEHRDGRFKVHPLADWSDRDVGRYLSRHQLPYHPLWSAGYISIGDVHTTRPWVEGMNDGDTRFFGLKRECGIHGLEG